MGQFYSGGDNSSQDFINVVTAFNHRLEVSLDQQSFHNKKSHEGQAITDILARLNQVGLVVTIMDLSRDTFCRF